MPPIQAHAYREDTVILRQNKSVHHEAPFLYLLFGAHTALLVDTGATPEPEFFPLRRTVDALVARWLAVHPARDYRLVVAHSHAHGDHVAGDAQFADRPDTTVVGHGVDDVVAFYGFTGWPGASRELDLGDRVVDVVPGPGHEASAVVFHDRRTGLLLTGDTLCRGRLYVWDLPTYRATVDRLVDFCADREITHVLGGHIEMTATPGRDYPIGATHQPDEAPLRLGVEHVRALRDALDEVGDATGMHVFPDFVVHRHEIHDHTGGAR